jgi:hypothetical protein
LKVDLCNAANQPVSAQGDVVIQITSDQGTSQSATLHSGDKSVELQFTFSSPGIARVTASETHLLSGSTLMRVLPKSSPATQPALENGSGRRTISTALPQLGSVGRQFTAEEAHEVRIETSRSGLTIPSASAGAPPPPAIAAGPSPGASAPAASPRSVLHLYADADPTRHLLADGTDGCSIYALLDNPPATPMSVNLIGINGNLSPTLLTLNQADNFEGSAKLTCNTPSQVTVNVLNRDPSVDYQGMPIQLQFEHPVHCLRVDATPGNISMLENATVVVTLCSEPGQATPTDIDRYAILTVAGDGILSTIKTKIPAGQSASEPATFTPRQRGQIKLTASVDGIPLNSTNLTVRLPVAVVLLTLLGGGCGGVAAVLSEGKRNWSRIVVGVITGVLLYWAAFYGVLDHFQNPAVSAAFFSAWALAAIGGFAGTKVFDPLMKLLGLADRAAAASP